jgi:hypothetical protein
VSIVGCDRLPVRYYQVKTEQEDVVARGPLPWTAAAGSGRRGGAGGGRRHRRRAAARPG